MPWQAVVFIKLRAEFADNKAASGLEVVVPMPPEVQRLSCDHATEARPMPVAHLPSHLHLPVS